MEGRAEGAGCVHCSWWTVLLWGVGKGWRCWMRSLGGATLLARLWFSGGAPLAFFQPCILLHIANNCDGGASIVCAV